GTTRLHYAVKEGYEVAVQYFIEKGDPLDSKDKNGNTALHYATHYGHTKLTLLKLGVDPNRPDDKGNMPLVRAIERRRKYSVKALLEYGANPNVQCAYPSLVYRLLTKMPIPPDGHSDPPCNDLDIAELLLLHGADPFFRDENQRTLLHCLVQNAGHSEARIEYSLIKLLLKKGVDIDAMDFRNYLRNSTLKHNQGSKDDAQSNILEINARDKFGCTALHYAVLVGEVHIVRALVEAKADITITNNEGDTPLVIALK
ncbi:ankyrin, partial [Zopfia rhizophila CBS 207.26]